MHKATSVQKSSSSTTMSLSRSEGFLNHLLKLGYKPPKHLKPEHFDYLFKNEKTAIFVDGLMAKVGPQNVLSKDELEKLKMLEKNGMMLYGKDLEEAVKSRKALDDASSVKFRDEVRRIKELKKKIQLEKKEFVEIEKMDQVLDVIIETKEREKQTRKKAVRDLEKESENLDLEICVAQKSLENEQRKLQDMEAQLLTRLSNASEKRLMFYWDWETFIKREEDLHNEIEQLIRDRIPGLKTASENYDDSNLEVERMEETLTARVENFERLRHSIIYEKAKEYKLNLKLATEKAAINAMEALIDRLQATHTAMNVSMSASFSGPSEKNLESKISLLERALAEEREQNLHKVREHSLQNVDSTFSCIFGNQNRAKRRLQNFISGVLDILVSQKVRIDLARHFLSKEIEIVQFSNLLERLTDLQHQLEALDKGTTSEDNPVVVRTLISPEDEYLLDLLIEAHDIDELSIDLKQCLNLTAGQPSLTLEEKEELISRLSNLISQTKQDLLQINQQSSAHPEVEHWLIEIRRQRPYLESLDCSVLMQESIQGKQNLLVEMEKALVPTHA